MEPVSILISLVALGLSIFALWQTNYRRGKLEMTQPAVVYFGPGRDGAQKVFLRTLLFSTAPSGQRLEHMFIRLNRGDATQAFSIWVFGERAALRRGSGLFVPQSGIEADHHFLLSKREGPYEFRSGMYQLQVMAQRVGDEQARQVATAELDLSTEHASALQSQKVGVYFDWSPETKSYSASLDEPKPRMTDSEDGEFFGAFMREILQKPPAKS